MSDLYIGLMSGTSVDGIDAALVDFSENFPKVIATHYEPYPTPLKEKILALCQQGSNEIERMGELDSLLGKEFARAVNDLLSKQSLQPSAIQAIGSHGQTIRHHPQQFTLQIGDPNIIAAHTGITTIADFRRKDIAHGGHGAPLVPAFHRHVFARIETNRAIVNIGGIANITILAPHRDVIGFDTGPGNVLLDAWIKLNRNESHDAKGAWGQTGTVQQKLLQQFLADAYFQESPPKSTGRERFNLTWLQQHLHGQGYSPTDVQATLVELTAYSIMNDISKFIQNGEVLICGGGAHNDYLMSRLNEIAHPNIAVHSTQKYGINPDWVEAVAFAWLAKQTLKRQAGNLPSVTGAAKATVLGGIYFAD